MIQQGNFLLMDRDEFRDWLSEQVITRPIQYLQVHHTASPNYSTRKMVNGIAQQDVFKCLEGMRNYHLSEGWAATGQNITTLENGQIAISLDRPLNRIPAGIRGFNNKCICIENVGNFDSGGDIITDEQKKTIIHLYACLAEKFNLPIDIDHIVFHAWYTRTGERLNDYFPGESSKSCPGTAFWGDGNTIAAAKKNFIPQIQAELDGLKGKIKNNISEDDQPMTSQEKVDFQTLQDQVKELTDKLQMDSIPDWAMEACVAAKNTGAVDTTSGGSYDFYRLITVLYRKGFFK